MHVCNPCMLSKSTSLYALKALMCMNSVNSRAAGVDYDDVLQRLTTVEFMFERKKRNAISTDDVQCFNVTILSDIVVEDTEFFYAELSTDDRFVLLNPQHATIHIRSDDRE